MGSNKIPSVYEHLAWAWLAIEKDKADIKKKKEGYSGQFNVEI